MPTKDQLAKINQLHKPMAAQMEAKYTERNQHVTDVNPGFIDETTYGEVITSLGTPCHAYTFDLTPPGVACVLDYALPVRNDFLKHNGLPKSEGLITHDERSIMTQIVRQDLAYLEAAWQPLEVKNVTDATIEQEKEELKILDKNDTVILVAFECHMQHANGLINIVYPIAVIDALIDKIDAIELS